MNEENKPFIQYLRWFDHRWVNGYIQPQLGMKLNHNFDEGEFRIVAINGNRMTLEEIPNFFESNRKQIQSISQIDVEINSSWIARI